MANTTVGVRDETPGVGVQEVAADDLGAAGVLQRIKLDVGAEGATDPVVALVPGHVPVSGPATDAELRATPLDVVGVVAVSGAVTVNVGLTDTELRATPVPVSGTVATGGLTDAQLRAAAVPVSLAHPALTPAVPTSASVGVASAQALAANASRKGLVLINRSNNVISLGFGQTAVLDDGISLEPMGGGWTMTKDTFTTAAVNAIAGGAGSKLGIQEFTT